MIELTKEGKKTINRFNFIVKNSKSLGQRIITEIGADAEKQTRPKIPIDTASMVSTLRKKIGILQVSILVGGIFARFSRKGRERKFVDYARYVNDGTSKQQGRFFMERGALAAVNNSFSIGRRVMNSWLRSILK